MTTETWKRDDEAWRAAYARDGYLVVPGVVEPELLDALRAEMDRIEERVADGALPPHLMRHVSRERDRTRGLKWDGEDPGGDAISNVMELPLFAPVFRDLIAHERTLDVLEALFGSAEFHFHNYKCICKMPGNGARFQWHRDLPYLPHTTPDLITCMLCLDPMTAENGATVVCPGTHRIPHAAVSPADTDIPEADVPAERVTVECAAGSAVLFHACLVHGGGPNRSDAKRRNAISIWAGPGCHPTTAHRYAYEFVMPRSADPARKLQTALTFGTLPGSSGAA